MPTIGQYIDTLSNPHGLTRTLSASDVERDSYRRIKVCSGRNAAVFRLRVDDRRTMLKCYFKELQDAEAIYGYVCGIDDRLLLPARYLPEELYVYDHNGNGEYYGVVVAPWAEGTTLDNCVRMAAAAGDSERLASLAESFERMAAGLLSRPWAHGDLKPENIIVGEDGAMKLIDYDAMFVPALAGRRTTQVGTLSYQHPARDCGMYDKHLDDYPIALISVSLHALAEDPSLYARHMCGDGAILHPARILSEEAPLYEELLRRWDSQEKRRLYRLAQKLRSPSPRLEELEKIINA